MQSSEILAIIVSFNGLEKTMNAVKAVRGKVGHIHVVDNASEADSRALLRGLDNLPDVSVDWLNENRGIGHALNLGIARAREGGYGWLLTMDQDSRVDEGMIEAFRQSCDNDRTLVCLTPSIMGQGAWRAAGNRVVDYAITSGNLVKVEVFDRIGLYNTDMFIDCVDFDFCLRLRGVGWSIHQVGAAFLNHELGEQHRLTGPLARYYTLHSPLRRYYMFRNFFLLTQLHCRRFPVFFIKSAFAHFALLLLMPFFDKAPRASFSAVGYGVLDFFMDRFGKCKRRF